LAFWIAVEVDLDLGDNSNSNNFFCHFLVLLGQGIGAGAILATRILTAPAARANGMATNVAGIETIIVVTFLGVFHNYFSYTTSFIQAVAK
jgi:hypothetical protein